MAADQKTLEDRLDQLKATHVDSALVWYRKHKWAPLVSYRIAGILTLVLGALLPAATLYKDAPWYPAFVAAAGAAIVVATSLEGFFQWRLNWQSRCHAERELSRAVAEWEVALAEAAVLPDEARAREARVAATRILVRRASEITRNETSEFFKRMSDLKSHDKPKAEPTTL